jgi:hypothetical protein
MTTQKSNTWESRIVSAVFPIMFIIDKQEFSGWFCTADHNSDKRWLPYTGLIRETMQEIE